MDSSESTSKVETCGSVGMNVSVGIPGFRAEVKNVAEKVCGIFGEKAREGGRAFDDETKDVNLHVGL